MKAKQKKVLDAALNIIGEKQWHLSMSHHNALFSGKVEVANICAHQQAVLVEVRASIVATMTLEDPAKATE
jgi:hypothetical protein